MAKHPRIKRNDLTVDQAWTYVTAHLDWLGKLCRRMVQCDHRLDANELENELVIDLVENVELWDMDRSFKGWAASRAQKCRLYMFRHINKHERGIERLKRASARNRPETDEDVDPLALTSVSSGAFGNADRSEAFVLLQQLIAMDPELQGALSAALHGLRSHRFPRVRHYDLPEVLGLHFGKRRSEHGGTGDETKEDAAHGQRSEDTGSGTQPAQDPNEQPLLPFARARQEDARADEREARRALRRLALGGEPVGNGQRRPSAATMGRRLAARQAQPRDRDAVR